MTVETTLGPAGPYACDQWLHRHCAVSRDLVARCAPLQNGAAYEARLAHACSVDNVPPHRVLPGSVRRGLDRAPEHAPAHIRVRPEVGRGGARGDIRDEPQERAVVVLVLPGLEVELQPGAKRKPGAIRKKVAQGRAFGPAACAQLRHVCGHRVIERQPACFRETTDHRRDH